MARIWHIIESVEFPLLESADGDFMYYSNAKNVILESLSYPGFNFMSENEHIENIYMLNLETITIGFLESCSEKVKSQLLEEVLYEEARIKIKTIGDY